MKKILSVMIAVFLACVLFSYTAEAENEYDFEGLKNELSDSLFSSVSDEVGDALEAIGITELNFDDVYNVSLSGILSYFTPQIKEKGKDVLKSFSVLLTLVLLLSVFNVILENNDLKSTLSVAGAAFVILFSFSGINGTINSCLSVLKVSSSFIVSYVPILTLIISFSGNPASALVYNSFVLGITEVLSAVVSFGLIDFIGMFFCLAVAFSMNESLNTSKIISAVNKTVSFVLGISGSLFSGVLTLKNIMAVSVDSVSVKGVRFLLSTFVPIVGSSISEAYSSVLGSINLIKGSVAVVGILCVVIINLPVIIEALMYYISFSALSYISETGGCKQVSDLFKAICCTVRILMILVVFEMFLLIISTGIMLTFKNT